MLLLFFKFKGELTWKMQDGLKTEKMCNHFHLQASFGGFVPVYTREVPFLAANWSSPGCSHVG